MVGFFVFFKILFLSYLFVLFLFLFLVCFFFCFLFFSFFLLLHHPTLIHVSKHAHGRCCNPSKFRFQRSNTFFARIHLRNGFINGYNIFLFILYTSAIICYCTWHLLDFLECDGERMPDSTHFRGWILMCLTLPFPTPCFSFVFIFLSLW